MRAWLDKLYDAAAWLAALMMVGTLVMVVLGMVDRYVPINFRGTDMYAGYFMAGSGFLALAHTLKKNEHIRVTLLLSALRPGDCSSSTPAVRSTPASLTTPPSWPRPSAAPTATTSRSCWTA